MPSRVVEICASAILAPAPVQAPATMASSQGWFGREQRELRDAAERVGRDVRDDYTVLLFGVTHQPCVLHNDVEIGTQPIGRIMTVNEAVQIFFRPVGQVLTQFSLGAPHALGPREFGVAAA